MIITVRTPPSLSIEMAPAEVGLSSLRKSTYSGRDARLETVAPPQLHDARAGCQRDEREVRLELCTANIGDLCTPPRGRR